MAFPLNLEKDRRGIAKLKEPTMHERSALSVLVGVAAAVSATALCGVAAPAIASPGSSVRTQSGNTRCEVNFDSVACQYLPGFRKPLSIHHRTVRLHRAPTYTACPTITGTRRGSRPGEPFNGTTATSPVPHKPSRTMSC